MPEDIEQLKKKYKNEWLAIKVTEEKNHKPLKGELIAHNPDRRQLHRAIQEKQPKDAYITFVGPPVKPGYGFILLLQ